MSPYRRALIRERRRLIRAVQRAERRHEARSKVRALLVETTRRLLDAETSDRPLDLFERRA